MSWLKNFRQSRVWMVVTLVLMEALALAMHLSLERARKKGER